MGALVLRAECQSARKSKIKNGRLGLDGAENSKCNPAMTLGLKGLNAVVGPCTSITVCVHCRASSASSVQPATRGLRRSADRLRRVLAVSVITTTLTIVTDRLAFVSVHTTRPELCVNSVDLDSTETPSSDDQVCQTLSYYS